MTRISNRDCPEQPSIEPLGAYASEIANGIVVPGQVVLTPDVVDNRRSDQMALRPEPADDAAASGDGVVPIEMEGDGPLVVR